MTFNLLEEMLKEKRAILADGATGTNIRDLAEREQISLPPAVELLNSENPELVRLHHRAYIEAGCDILLTNSWGANKYALAECNVELNSDAIREINRLAAQLLKEEISSVDRDVVCAGSVGPTGKIVADPEDHGPFKHWDLAYNEAVSAFQHQITGLLEGGVDVIWIESQINPHEVRAAVEALRVANKERNSQVPFVVSMVFPLSERTQAGYDLEHYIQDFGHGEAGPLAFGLNCGFGPKVALEVIARNKELWNDVFPILVKANCGCPRFEGKSFVPEGLSPEQMGRYAKLALDLGVKIVGGCCGSLPHHIRAMRETLNSYTLSPPPRSSEIATIIDGNR